MLKAIVNMARQSSDEFPATIYYAFKQSEIENEGVSSTGWATFLQAVIDAGYAVVGTWPVRTEKPGRMISVGTNALANSVVLVCRKRDDNAETLSRADFIRALKRELPPAIETVAKGEHCARRYAASGHWSGHGRVQPLQGRAGSRRHSHARKNRAATHQPRAR